MGHRTDSFLKFFLFCFILWGNSILLFLIVELFLVLLAVCKIPSTPIYWMDKILENEIVHWSILVILNFTLPNVVCHVPASNKFTISAKVWHNNITQFTFPFHTEICCSKLHLHCDSETFSPFSFPISVLPVHSCFPSSPSWPDTSSRLEGPEQVASGKLQLSRSGSS